MSDFDGLKFFYTQILTGDRADNIKGLYGVGPKKAEKMLAECKTEADMYEECLHQYGGEEYRVIENARLLWLRREPDQLWGSRLNALQIRLRETYSTVPKETQSQLPV